MSVNGRIYRWDLDKTYLRTEFETITGLVRTAFERAHAKQNVPGTAALIRELRRSRSEGAPSRVFFISGSPRQMRGVIEQKLKLDGVQWDGLVLKPNVENLLRGRFRAVKEQVGYKLPVLLESRRMMKPPSFEVMFGDDAEWDAFVYSLYADIIAGRVERDDIERTLQVARVYPDARERVFAALADLAPYDPVRRIFINLDRRTPPSRLADYGSRVVPIYNYFQASLVLGEMGDLDAYAVIRVALEMVNRHNYSVDELSNSYQEILRRGVISGRIGLEMAQALKDFQPQPGQPSAEEVLHSFDRRVRAIPIPPHQLKKVEIKRIDYPSLFVREQRRHAERKKKRVPNLFD